MTSLTGIVIATSNLDRTAEVYRAICDIESAGAASHGSTAEGGAIAKAGNLQIALQDATLALTAASTASTASPASTASTALTGVTSITLVVQDLPSRQRALQAAGIDVQSSATGLSIPASAANGLAVEILQEIGSAPEDATNENNGARLDHVALRVRDLPAASARWHAITGIEGQQMGLHPISGGAFSAARFLLGERMIELIAPVPGKESQVAARLASHGEGVAALALPVQDMDAARQRLAEADVRVIRQEPHWMVHPKDAAGVLIQLTPRVKH